MKIIATTGYGGTGSSAISDLLKEFNNCYSYGSFEFRFLQDPDGIMDLEYKLVENVNRLNNDTAIKRFKKYCKLISGSNGWWCNYNNIFDGKFNYLTEKYIKNLINFSWQGSWHQDEVSGENKITYKSKIYKIMKILKIKKYLEKNEKMYFSMPKEKFYSYTKEYLKELFQILNKENKEYLVLDQLIPALNTKKYTKYFDNIKIIIVDRDPRDLFVLNKEVWKEGWIPTNIETYIQWYKLLRENKEYHENILYLKFEDLVYKYEDTLKEIMNFLNENKENHINKMKFFNFQISKNNTQVFLNINKYKKEIEEIERRLAKYCYKFDEEILKVDINKIF
ncbi:hypothetical protein [Fusobacterium sp. THCT1E2]